MNKKEHQPLKRLKHLAKMEKDIRAILGTQRSSSISSSDVSTQRDLVSPDMSVKDAVTSRQKNTVVDYKKRKPNKPISELEDEIVDIFTEAERMAPVYYKIYVKKRAKATQAAEGAKKNGQDTKPLKKALKDFKKTARLQDRLPGLRAGLGRRGIWLDTPDDAFAKEVHGVISRVRT